MLISCGPTTRDGKQAMFALEFSLENAAFGDNSEERAVEIARILRVIAARVETDATTQYNSIHDSNGNYIGEWSIAVDYED